jgi:dTDP-glucose 4,6-dehydratase
MSQALRNEDVTIFGDGSQTRSFCFITDLVDGLLRLMASSTNEPVNIGNPHEVSIREIAEIIVRLVNSKSKLVLRRCRWTTRSSVSPTSPARARCSGGNRRWAWKMA